MAAVKCGAGTQARHPYHAMEESLAAVLAKADRLLAGALTVRLIRAFPATPSPARPPGPAQHPGWPHGGAGVRQQRTNRPASRVRSRRR